MTIANAVYREGVAFSPDGAMYVAVAPGGTVSTNTFASNTFSQTLLNSNIRTVIQQGGVPLLCPGSFTMGNNGAITLGTALNKVLTNGYIYMLAGDIAAGVPASAGFYFCQFTTTTAGTVFNNLLVLSGAPPLVTSPTAFVTTGPGARTGDTGAETVITTAIPVLAANSQVILSLNVIASNTAGTKTGTVMLGGTTFLSAGANSVTRAGGVFIVSNTGATNKQIGQYGPLVGYTVASQEGNGTVDTSAATSLVVTFQRGTATDNILVEPPLVEVAF